jgi:hypothetical protein
VRGTHSVASSRKRTSVQETETDPVSETVCSIAYRTMNKFKNSVIASGIDQWFSTFVKPRSGKFFFIRRRPDINDARARYPAAGRRLRKTVVDQRQKPLKSTENYSLQCVKQSVLTAVYERISRSEICNETKLSSVRSARLHDRCLEWTVCLRK